MFNINCGLAVSLYLNGFHHLSLTYIATSNIMPHSLPMADRLTKLKTYELVGMKIPQMTDGVNLVLS